MLIISSVKSNDGKTTITCGLAGVFYKLGLDFDFIKIGPDFIDPMCVGNFACVNKINLLSQYPEQFCRWLAWSRPCSLVEDCMGLMDSLDRNTLATTSLSLQKGNKFVLVLNCKNVIQTVTHLSSEVCSKLSGVIINNTVSYKHESAVINSVNQIMGVPVLGVLSANKVCFKQRYLGVIQPNEFVNSQKFVDDLVLETYRGCNIPKLIELMIKIGN